MSLARRAAAVVLALAVALASAPARAQKRDPAAATELFENGRRAVSRGDWPSACDSFAESFRLDPKVGSVLNLADCEEHLGHLASAHAHWQQGLDLARAQSDDRASYASERLGKLEPRVPRLTIHLAPDAPKDAVVARDGVELGSASIDAALPVDPGPHAIVVRAAGRAPRAFDLTLREGDRTELTVTAGASNAPEPAPAPPVVTTPPSPAPEGSRRLGVQRVAALGVGGAGVVAMGVGVALALGAKSKANGASCDASNACDAAGVAQRDDAYRLGNVATVVVIAGGALAASGVLLWLTAKSPSTSPSVAVGPSLGGAQLVGRF